MNVYNMIKIIILFISTNNKEKQIDDHAHSLTRRSLLAQEHLKKKHNLLRRRSTDRTQGRITARLKLKNSKKLKSVEIFNVLPSKLINEMVDCTELETFQNNAIIYSEGSIGDKFYAIITGKVNIVKAGSAGFTKTLEAPDVFGEGALLKENYERTATIKSSGKTTLLSLTREKFNELKKNNSNKLSLETIDETLEKNVAKYEKEDKTREAGKDENGGGGGGGFEV